MESKLDRNTTVDIEAGQLALPPDIRRRVTGIRGGRADGRSLDKRAVARSTPIVIPLIVQLGASLVYSLLFVGLVAFIATGLS